MSLIIRRAHAAELAETQRILAAAFAPRQPDPDTTNGAFARHLADVLNVSLRFEQAELFVAVEGALIRGSATLYPPGQGQAATSGSAARPWPSDWASLRALGVDPAQQRRGIGRRLSEARVQRARELGAAAVALHTSREFAVARQLIQAMGWQRLPEYDYAPSATVQAEAYVLRLH
ncbi:MAG: GNAT family N-acetyltransferase [Deltaproteobacteria bacterium]